jgi:hypothetical protein
VVFAAHWEATLGKPPSHDAHARVVFLNEPQTVPIGDLASSCVAACVPGNPNEANKTGGKRDVPEDATDTPGNAEFRRGKILAAAELSLDTGLVFSEPDRTQWVQAIAEGLLAAAYPSLSIDPSGFPHCLGEADITLLFGALVNRDSSVESQAAAHSFAPGLGLAKENDSSKLVDGCSLILDSIEDGLYGTYGTLLWSDLRLAMAEAGGLPGSLPLLFTLCLVRIHERRVELELEKGHDVTTIDGSPFPSRFLTASTMGDVRWDDALKQAPLRLLHQRQPTWDTVLPLVEALSHGLDESMPGEPDLGGLLETVRVQLDKIARESMRGDLAKALPDLVDATPRLEQIAAAGDIVGFYTACAISYNRPSLIRKDAETLLGAVKLFESGGQG